MAVDPAAGRDATLSKGGTVFAGLTNLKFNWQGEGIDSQSRENNGRPKYLSVLATESFTIEAEFVLKADVFRRIVGNNATSKLFTDCTLKWADDEAATDTLSCDMLLTGYSEDMPMNGVVTGSLTLASSGNWTEG